MDYPCVKFGDCSFSRFGSIVQEHTHTHTQTDAAERLSFATQFIKPSNHLLGVRTLYSRDSLWRE